MNKYKLKRSLIASSIIFGLTGLAVLGGFLATQYWFGPIILFGSLFTGVTILFYIFLD